MYIFVARMKTKLAILLLLLLTALPLTAQSVATGKRTPKLKEFNLRKIGSQYTCMIFIHSASEACHSAVMQVMESIDATDNITTILLTRESEQNYSTWLQQLCVNGSLVVSKASTIFSSLGIDYAPFAVITNAKRQVVWFGNPQTLNSQKIDTILSQWTLQR